MLAKLFDGWNNGLKIALVVVVSLAVGLLVWFITSRGPDSLPVARTLYPVDRASLHEALSSNSNSEVGVKAGDDLWSKGAETSNPDYISWSGWQLTAIDSTEISPTNNTTVRCRAMSTDRIPNNQILAQLAYQIRQAGQLDSANIHISQINNYYRCDLDLEWSAIVVGYHSDLCLDLTPLNGALSLITGQSDEATNHPAIAPWIGSGCSADPQTAGQISIEWGSADSQPPLAEVIYRGTFRVFIPKNDYSKIVSSIQVEIDSASYGILEPIRIKRL